MDPALLVLLSGVQIAGNVPYARAGTTYWTGVRREVQRSHGGNTKAAVFWDVTACSHAVSYIFSTLHGVTRQNTAVKSVIVNPNIFCLTFNDLEKGGLT